MDLFLIVTAPELQKCVSLCIEIDNTLRNLLVHQTHPSIILGGSLSVVESTNRNTPLLVFRLVEQTKTVILMGIHTCI